MNTVVVKLTVTDPQGTVTRHGVRVTGDADFVRIETVRGCAIPPGAVLPILARTGIVDAGVEDGRIVVSVPDSVRDRISQMRVGVHSYLGRSGAVWETAWKVDGQGFRIGRPLARWHVSMRGVLNEPVWGDPYLLVAFWALPQHYLALCAGYRFLVERDALLAPVDLSVPEFFRSSLLRSEEPGGDLVPFGGWRLMQVHDDLRASEELKTSELVERIEILMPADIPVPLPAEEEKEAEE